MTGNETYKMSKDLKELHLITNVIIIKVKLKIYYCH